ncbi:Fe-S cluster assembly protein SufD [Micromonospora sp. WMMA1998]|uniref:Iron-regulated ABC transporter permease protein SufD n=1 Tax=Micromonospora sediminicola TaxID=946078 RepID=A0A1A9B8S2_9ACTN|nr:MULTISPECIES: Fe-S cluster assembly protein SufD [Micromonospora]ATO17386.1 Fe-S cluster assembly protein SufD [Micromonospora sp. WMMA2032]PGH40769.1 Fe-S cluster assembly protein SufD [Micromonospora sp. WMMA1996]WBC16910.1 Fe-S cluster assembly protein SufD [Micromonospora sp. WMMA1998]SBT65471.1 Iron-regulated ABC transporter permease protein SufD [Micromonospora sediminicola]
MTTQASAPPTTKSQALRSYDVADFPALTGLEEEWRFTPLKRLRGLASSAQVATGAVRHEHGDLPEGVTVDRIGRDDPRVGSVLTPFDRVSALAYGGADGALLVQVARDAVVAEPVRLRVVGETAEALAFGHTFLEVGRFAEVTVVLEQVGSATLADNVEVTVADGAKLTLVTVADWADDAVQAQHLRVKLGRDAKIVHVQVSLGGDLVRQYTSVEYTQRGGEAELYGLYFADSGQHLEHRQLVDHTVPDCRSNVGYRGALQGDDAHTVWVGDVLIRAEATGTDTYEINRNLLLSDGARADSVPNLEIETGEIAGAGHASATGRFDDEQLFYLMARGIPEAEARRLVVRGFFAEMINKIPVEDLRERLGDAIEARLAKAGA